MKKTTESRENLVNSVASLATNTDDGRGGVEADFDGKSIKSGISEFDREIPELILTKTEKTFLLSAERGDCASVRR